MKSEYILNAVAAMHEADSISFTMSPHQLATILNKLATARVELAAYSGLGNIDVPVEVAPPTFDIAAEVEKANADYLKAQA